MPILTETGALRAWYALLMVLLAAALLVVVNIAYTAYAQEENNRKWCDVMTTLDTQNTPATTPQAVDFRRKIHKLRLGLGCGGGTP
jgi:hypothetical protein